jgi:hypothetical protein
LTIKPYGEGLIVDIIGKQFQGNSFASVVINADGQVTAIIPDVSSIPGNDGSIWRFRVLDNTIEGELPFAIDKYDFEKNNWQFNTQGSITRRANLYKQNKEAFIRPIGVDQYGRMTIKISEGFPLSPRFIRIGNNGKIESDIRFEDFNFDPKPLTWYFPSECYQLLTDGSILALYASPDRFKIIRIIATTDKTLQ